MGIEIFGTLLPWEVSDEQWAGAYNDALKLVEAFDFLDVIVDTTRYKKFKATWYYAVKSRERDLDDGIGVAIAGALNSCISAETNLFYRDLAYYKNSRHAPSPKPKYPFCHDALFSAVEYGEKWAEKFSDRVCLVFGAKTQGYVHHLPLLAIALLFEDRLGKAFTVYGDINRAQIKTAIEWANKHLDRPISMPCRTDNARLLERLAAFTPPECLLKTFIDLTYSPQDEDLHGFLAEHFSFYDRLQYWKERASTCVPGTVGASDFFKQFFGMSSDLKMLAYACAKKFTITEFVKQLAVSRVFEQEKDTSNPVAFNSSDADNPQPDTIEAVFGKLFMFGLRNSAVSRTIPLEQGIAVLRNVTENGQIFGGEEVDLGSLLQTAVEAQRSGAAQCDDTRKLFEENVQEFGEEINKVDIYEPDYLALYVPGAKILDRLAKKLRDIRTFVDNHKDRATADYSKAYAKASAKRKKNEDNQSQRLAFIIRRCNTLLPKTSWDAIEQRVADDQFFFTLLAVLSIDATTLPTAHYVKALLCNQQLFDKVLFGEGLVDEPA